MRHLIFGVHCKGASHPPAYKMMHSHHQTHGEVLARGLREVGIAIKKRPNVKPPLILALYISLLQKQKSVDSIYCTN